MVCLKPDQRLTIESDFEAIAQAGTEGGLEGQTAFRGAGVLMGARVFEPEFDLERLDGDCVRAGAHGRPIGLHLQESVVSCPDQGRQAPAAEQNHLPPRHMAGSSRWRAVTPRP